MCYYIYGALFGDIDLNNYQALENNYEMKIRLGTKHDVKMSVQHVDCDYRVTEGCCDCESDLGKGDIDAEEVKQCADLLNDIKNIKGAEYIYLCKTWAGKNNKKEKHMKLGEINIQEVLANFEENCLYIFEV